MSTKAKPVNGVIIDRGNIRRQIITVRFTSDKIGETISLADEINGIMIIVPFESVAELIERTRGNK